MTKHEWRRWTRAQRRLRRIELLLKTTLAVVVVAAAAVIACVFAAEEPKEPPTPAAEVSAPAESKPAAEPVKAEIKGNDEEEPETAPAPRYNITEEELDIVARVVHSEARGEGFDGQALVAQCILNTAEATGKRPDEVVLEPGQYAAPAAEASEEVIAAVRAVFIDGYQVTDEPIRWFYAYKRCNSAWHESKRHILTYKNHKFFA